MQEIRTKLHIAGQIRDLSSLIGVTCGLFVAIFGSLFLLVWEKTICTVGTIESRKIKDLFRYTIDGTYWDTHDYTSKALFMEIVCSDRCFDETIKSFACWRNRYVDVIIHDIRSHCLLLGILLGVTILCAGVYYTVIRYIKKLHDHVDYLEVARMVDAL